MDKKQAIEDFSKPIRIIAAPGSGKTELISNKFLEIAQNAVFELNRVLVVTFSNKAAEELKHRIKSKLNAANIDYSEQDLEISTIHGFCQKALKNNSELITGSIKNQGVLDEVGQGSFILSFIEKFGFRNTIEATPKVYNELIPFFNLISDENLTENVVYNHLVKKFKKILGDQNLNYNEKERQVKSIKDLIYYNSFYNIYKSALISSGFTDFSHMQRFVYDEFTRNKNFLDAVRSKYDYILVDEFQDTSYLQSEIILKIADPHFRITVCGDDDQSLYRFRGATVQNFLGLQNQITIPLEDFYLDTNYRSSQNIVDHSKYLIENNNPYRLSTKKIQSKSNITGCCFHFQSENPIAESQQIIELIQTLKTTGKIRDYSQIAILFRSVVNESSNIIEELNKKLIPYKIYGSDKLVSSQYLKDLIHIVQFCSKYIKQLDKQTYFYQLTDFEFDEFQRANWDSLNLRQISTSDSFQFVRQLLEVKNKLSNKQIFSNLGFLYEILNSSNKFKELIKNRNNNVLSDFGYLSQIINQFDDTYKRTDPFLLSKVLETISIKGYDESGESNEGHVQIMTIHQSKGLEFDFLFLPNQITTAQKTNKYHHLFEILHYETQDPETIRNIDERKVFYVAMTRAKNNLILSGSKNIPWGKKTRKTKVSQYILESKIRTISFDELQLKIRNIPQIISTSSTNVQTLTLNYSKIQTYKTCGRKYDLKYNQKFNTVLESGMDFGSSLHAAINTLHQNYLTHKKIQYTEKELRQIIEVNWIDLKTKRKETKELQNTAIKYLFSYHTKNQGLYRYITFSEKSFNFADIDYTFNGIFDLILNQEDKVIIVDFKTSNINNPAYDHQMQLYAFAYQKIFGKIPHEIKLHSLKDGTINLVSFNQDSLNSIKDELRQITNKIKNNEFDPVFGKHCSQCPFKEFCKT